MSDPIERNIDFLDGAEKTNVPLLATLIGFKRSFQERLGIEKFPLVMHDNPRKAIKKAYKNSRYPYGYFRMTNLVLSDEQTLHQNIRRMGSGHSIQDIENVLVQKGFYFPADVTIEVKYLDDDINGVINFVQKLAIINACRLLSFDIKLPGSDGWNVNVTADTKGASIPSPIEDDEDRPAVYEIDASYVLQTKVGFEKVVAKINNEGSITHNVMLEPSRE